MNNKIYKNIRTISKMKKIYLTLVFCFGLSVLNAQVVIEKASITPPSILDFPTISSSGTGIADGGIALPRADNTDKAGITSGTFLVDASTKKVRYYGETWVDLTPVKSTNIVSYDASFQEKGEGIHISDNSVTETLKGVLTLSSDNKALQLPVVEDVTQLPEPPYAGMICYDKKSKSLAVFNGEKWSFWN